MSPFIRFGQLIMQGRRKGRGHCGAPTAAAGTGVLRALVAAERPGEPVRGPKAVEAGKAEIPSRSRVRKGSLGTLQPSCHIQGQSQRERLDWLS